MASLVPLKKIVQDCCANTGDTTFRYYDTFLRHVVNGFSEIHRYLSPDTVVKTEVFPVDNASRSVSLPADCVNVTKVALCTSTGVGILWVDKSLKCYDQTVDTQSEAAAELARYLAGQFAYDFPYTFYNVYWDGTYYPTYTGYGQGFANGLTTYRHIRRTNTLEFSSIIPSESKMLIEYRSDGINDGLELIPIEWEQAVKRFALSEFYLVLNPNLSARLREQYQMEYNRIKKFNFVAQSDFWDDLYIKSHKKYKG